MQPIKLGILALQGAVQPHQAKLAAMGVDCVLVRRAEELSGISGLILPGGESSTFLKLILLYDLEAPLRNFAASHPMWGVCAGSILMAETVENPPQNSLALLPMTVVRNAYGAQNNSFITTLSLHLGQTPDKTDVEVEGVFIRAPRFTALDAGMEVLAYHGEDPVVVRKGRHLATAYHPELSPSDELHRYFVDMCRENLIQASA